MNWSPTMPEEDWSRVATCAAGGPWLLYSLSFDRSIFILFCILPGVSLCCHLLSPVHNTQLDIQTVCRVLSRIYIFGGVWKMYAVAIGICV